MLYFEVSLENYVARIADLKKFNKGKFFKGDGVANVAHRKDNFTVFFDS